jgi:hypothetical protein
MELIVRKHRYNTLHVHNIFQCSPALAAARCGRAWPPLLPSPAPEQLHLPGLLPPFSIVVGIGHIGLGGIGVGRQRLSGRATGQGFQRLRWCGWGTEDSGYRFFVSIRSTERLDSLASLFPSRGGQDACPPAPGKTQQLDVFALVFLAFLCKLRLRARSERDRSPGKRRR